MLVSAMAKRHEAITDWIAPHLKDGQIVCFSAGNCASITLKKKRGDKKVIVGEMQGNIGSCRLVSPTKEIKGNPHTFFFRLMTEIRNICVSQERQKGF